MVDETNYYGGGGSKLKAVAGEFTELSQFVVTSDDDVEFVWVTDGQGWKLRIYHWQKPSVILEISLIWKC